MIGIRRRQLWSALLLVSEVEAESRMEGGSRVGARGWREFLKWTSLQQKGQLAWAILKEEKCRILVWKIKWAMRSIHGNRKAGLFKLEGLSWMSWAGAELHLGRSYGFRGLEHGTDFYPRVRASERLRTLGWVEQTFVSKPGELHAFQGVIGSAMT